MRTPKTEEYSYAALAQAIINQALHDIKKNNRYARDAEVFLETDWYETLKFLVDLYFNPGGCVI